MFVRSLKTSALLLGAALGLAAGPAAAAWEPTKAVTFIIPAGTGGGADQMARFIQGVIQKNNLMSKPVVVLNKGGGAGAEGFLEMKASARDPHKIIITLSNLFTTPLGTGAPFNWKDMKPVTMLALDQFVLWTNAEKNYPDAKAYIDAVKAAPDRQFKMGGTGSKQEDQIITAAIERHTDGKKFIYIPYDGGGKVAVQLVGGHIDSSVNNPIEAVAQWRGKQLKPLCIFDAKRSTHTAKITEDMAWSDIPTCKESGLPVEYQMLRGIFTTSGATDEQVAFYVDLFKKVMATEDWKAFMDKGAFNETTMSGPEFEAWLTEAEKTHRELMQEAGFLAQAQ
ncbi:tripartite tricarboxylate transporter substrate binding protein [Hansschlegelia sp.]|uniref:tripartite tricarboxylate transporter substrate binding protein n=1 Tax=Hansschlegelia sp. TaxID=2041892 RepID=UPI002C50E9FD|nr:tripartite tricarboxylate transporter substrate-binding protein [Hansschlegelia sp.]HVI27400.1 tripartite tricarboxylate transporter substrate-binding protein [Hansschlegelia sp.]